MNRREYSFCSFDSNQEPLILGTVAAQRLTWDYLSPLEPVCNLQVPLHPGFLSRIVFLNLKNFDVGERRAMLPQHVQLANRAHEMHFKKRILISLP